MRLPSYANSTARVIERAALNALECGHTLGVDDVMHAYETFVQDHCQGEDPSEATQRASERIKANLVMLGFNF